MTEQDNILLQTKLHRPRLPQDHMPRVRLIDHLNGELSRQLILIRDPAGSGKTPWIGA